MTQNDKTPRVVAGASQKTRIQAADRSAATVSPVAGTGQQASLFEADEAMTDRPIARPLQVATRGRDELVVRCPRCAQMHRHTGLGLRRAPCGALYRVEPKRPRGRAA